MEEPYGEGVASHTGPESCVVVRKGRGEALTGVHAGRVLSRETLLAAATTRTVRWIGYEKQLGDERLLVRTQGKSPGR
jgi:hypothetical protein